MAVLRMYDLLPEIYHEMDTDGQLEVFLDALQVNFQEWYDDEAGLRKLQDIRETPGGYIKYIARSLGWTLQDPTEEGRRNECAMIADLYDLKGTPYAIRLISRLSFDRFFKKLGEMYTPIAASASTITTTPSDDLAALLASEGEFVYEDWNAEGGFTYHYDPLYSYFVFIVINPDDYVYGEFTPKFKKFLVWLHTMHPAGRFCYPYILCRGWRAEHYKTLQMLYEEITGLKTFDDLEFLDDGGAFDEDDSPIHPSVSTKFYIEWGCFDDEGTLDDAGFFDDGQWELHGIAELA